MKFLLKLLIGLVVLIVILAIAVVIVLNLTPRQLKINEISIMDTSIDDLGLSDTKIIDIIKSIKNIGKVEEEDVVENPYNEEQESKAADTNTKGSSLESKSNYASIVSDKVTYDNKYLIEYKDTTIAYMLNDAIQNSTDSSEAIQTLKDANITFKELTISKDNSSLRAVCLVDLGGFKSDIESTLGPAASIIKIPDKVYLVSDLTITGVDVNGKLTVTSKDICINGNNNDPVSKAIMKIISSITGSEDVDSINNEIGNALTDTIANLGRIGTATTDANKVVVDSTIQIGTAGIYNNKITVITYVIS